MSILTLPTDLVRLVGSYLDHESLCNMSEADPTLKKDLDGLMVKDYVYYQHTKPNFNYEAIQTDSVYLGELMVRIPLLKKLDLHIGGMVGIKGILNLPFLEELTVKGHIENFSNLTNLTKLIIDCNNAKLPFNQPINNLTNLTSLDIGSFAFNQPINNLTNLTVLKIKSYFFNQPINNLTNLTKLVLGGIFDFNQPINNLTNLTELYIRCHHFNQPLNSLTKLTILRIISLDFNQPLDNLTNLTMLYIDCRYFNQPLYNLTNLTELHIRSDAFNQLIFLSSRIMKNFGFHCPKYDYREPTYLGALRLQHRTFPNSIQEPYYYSAKEEKEKIAEENRRRAGRLRIQFDS